MKLSDPSRNACGATVLARFRRACLRGLPYFLFFASGASALIYETAWVREVGRSMGNTSTSVAMVTGLFVAGLGLGGFLAARLALMGCGQRTREAWRAYGLCELLIALLGMVMLWAGGDVLPRMAAGVAVYATDAAGLHVMSTGAVVWQFLIVALFILPAAMLMGATFPMLLRITPHAAGSPGWQFGLLYAVNTAGAMTGCLLVDFALVPWLGTRATQATAVSINLCVGVISCAASCVSQRRQPGGAADLGARPEGDALPVMLKRFVLGCAVVGVSGFLAMGLQLIWNRFLATALGGTRGVFSVLLAVILGGVWIGSVAGGLCVRRSRNPWWLAATGLGFTVASALAGLAWYHRGLIATGSFVALREALGRFRLHALADVAFVLRTVLPVAGPASFWAGFTVPAAIGGLNPDRTSFRRTSTAYLVNCLGAGAGASVTAFWLLPGLGMQLSILALSGLVVLLTLALWRYCEESAAGARHRWSAATLALLAVLGCWQSLPSEYLLRKMFAPAWNPGGFLALSEDVVETIAVDEHPVTHDRFLLTNGHPMSGTSLGSVRYMRLFSHVPLLQMQAPRDALVICFGVGNTLHAASLYPSLRRLEVVDTSRHVIGHAGYFADWNHSVLEDPRVGVYINDGRQHLRMQPRDRYDLITLEPPPLAHAGVSSLYTREFYQLAYSRLRPGGFMTQWLPALQVPEPVLRAAVRAFVDVFPNAVLLNGHGENFILLGRKSLANNLDLHQVAANLEALPQVRDDLADCFAGSLTELLGTFVASPERLDIFSDGAEPLVDDRPSMEYAYLSFLETSLPRDLVGPRAVREWCREAGADGGAPGAGLARLPEYLSIMENYYLTMPPVSFLKPRAPHELTIDLRRPGIREAVRESPYLQALVGAMAPHGSGQPR